MDQIKIGKFIAERRKNQGLTQMHLAEKLNVTDRAVSKWENGKSMPDSSIMLELCGILKITVNDLLSGEVVTMELYNKQLEQNLIEMIKEKEEANRRNLVFENVIGILSAVILFGRTFTAAFVSMVEWARICLIVAGFVIGFTGLLFALRIEQTAGYYRCGVCGHRYVPKYGSVLWAMHFGRTRYMKCPKCGKRSWQKKVLTKDEE
ncbi:MAG: helix-turn-helix transcriptional regulator [Clostridia bacterium]|nr:helix-turn-helix transcriptional regulator [Clostridia bacterium]